MTRRSLPDPRAVTRMMSVRKTRSMEGRLLPGVADRPLRKKRTVRARAQPVQAQQQQRQQQHQQQQPPPPPPSPAVGQQQQQQQQQQQEEPVPAAAAVPVPAPEPEPEPATPRTATRFAIPDPVSIFPLRAGNSLPPIPTQNQAEEGARILDFEREEAMDEPQDDSDYPAIADYVGPGFEGERRTAADWRPRVSEHHLEVAQERVEMMRERAWERRQEELTALDAGEELRPVSQLRMLNRRTTRLLRIEGPVKKVLRLRRRRVKERRLSDGKKGYRLNRVYKRSRLREVTRDAMEWEYDETGI
ncbi:hypothetical protein LZ554_004729 [Drepanopeziza brunnea f. sp. 'monogermtubi']|nr:hypothetical protein LZ554_004729 [Drepanopeziza brunnea f. sp. 'monogermtubi']